RLLDRGFDQAVLLAATAARELELQSVAALERRESTAAQHALGRADRARNVEGVFAVPPVTAPLVRGRWVVLIDDVTTTGATLAGCAAALRKEGVVAVSALTV